MKFRASLFFLFNTLKTELSYNFSKEWLRYNFRNNLIYGNDTTKIINCEHLIPKYYLKKNDINKKAFNDLHLLHLANAKINSHRQHYKFDNLEDNKSIYLNVNGDVTEDDRYCAKSVKKKLFDPPDESKGIIARSICYFYWTYNLSFHKDILDRKTLISWNKQYKVRDFEKNKNKKVFNIQQNKNIFVEYPFLVNIFCSKYLFFLKFIFDKLKSKKKKIKKILSKCRKIRCLNKITQPLFSLLDRETI